MCRQSVLRHLFLSSVAIIFSIVPTYLIFAAPGIATATTSVASVPPETKPIVAIEMKSRHSAIELAAAELAKFLGQMADDPKAAVVAADGSENAARIELGLFDDFGLPVDGLEDPALDDAIHIDVSRSKGTIAGSNPRSVLFAAYRFLEACGCRWIRPGRDGDYVPSRSIDDLSVRLSDQAVYRFRGNNNCGSYNLNHVLDKIAWAPKVGLNTFFNEFFLPRFLYNDWYSRNYPSLKEPQPRADAEILAYHELAVRELKRRGMLNHAVGHGWTGVFFGNPEAECDHRGHLEVPADQTEYLALVKGERVTSGPTTTDLCYGNPEVRRRLVTLVADYAEAHPEVDFLHFWLDDRMNDTCECELCRHTRVGDFYVMILNDIDTELTRRTLSTRIVFLIYQDLLWPPEKERLLNQDRFVLMFAPISRLYDEPYDFPADDVSLPPYRLNQNKSPNDIKLNVGFLEGWQRQSQGIGFVFDYHMIWHHYFDPGYYGLTKVLAEDIRRLPKLGLHGFVSCQIMRAFFPHGFPLYAHAKLLWNPQYERENLAQEYFEGSFGSDGQQALEYMKALSELFSPTYFYRMRRTRTGPTDDEEAKQVAEKLARVPHVVIDFQPVIEKNLETDNSAHRLSWKYLSVHTEMATTLANVLRARVEGRKSLEDEYWKRLTDYLTAHEDDMDAVFDPVWFRSSVQRRD